MGRRESGFSWMYQKGGTFCLPLVFHDAASTFPSRQAFAFFLVRDGFIAYLCFYLFRLSLFLYSTAIFFNVIELLAGF